MAELIRKYDRIHGLGDEDAHWLAIRSLSVAAYFLQSIVPGSAVVDYLPQSPSRVCILDCITFFNRLSVGGSDVPHMWDVTSDSLAAKVARTSAAQVLVMLKSTTVRGTDWNTATANGWVDPYFPTAVAGAPFPVEAVNFRRWLDESFHGE
jgi:aspartokinase-like uncharacterized kinase